MAHFRHGSLHNSEIWPRLATGDWHWPGQGPWLAYFSFGPEILLSATFQTTNFVGYGLGLGLCYGQGKFGIRE